LARRWRPRAVVLLYHRVAETSDDPYGQAVAPARFESHLALLRREYHVASLESLVEKLDRRDYPDRTVAVSFDDGYADNLAAAAPLALRQEVPLTVFVTVEPVVEGTPFWWDELAGALGPQADGATRERLHAELKRLPGGERRRRLAAIRSASPAGAAGTDGADRGAPLSPSGLRELAALPGVTIGAHTLSHPSLAALAEGEQARELAGGRARLEELLGRPVTLLAYPFGKPGDVAPETRRLAAGAGYRAAFTSAAGRIVPSSPRFALPRLTVHDGSPEALAQRLSECFAEPAPRPL
ncbi:MAG TPA: polysaccharide deacetylase family protein, partial [Thermoanaerobaculia bacterium]|nr:polysaccharide deacetylase family protein [Thermoanaerobaculia bacterium]